MYCPNCGKVQPDTAKFCEKCGTNVSQFEKTCPVCRTKYITNACPNCGFIANNTTQSQPAVYTQAPPPTIATPQQSQQSRICCPRCRGTSVIVQAVNYTQLKNIHHGWAWWLFVGWWWLPIKWLIFTIPALIVKLLKPKKQQIVNTTHSVAVCQSCGYQWRI